MEVVESLLESYDGFQRMKLGRPHLRLSAEATLELVPGLKREGLVGSLAFDEWAVRPKELVRRNVESAARFGGEANEGAKAESLIREDGRIVGARVVEDGKAREIRARIVVNATGPWVDETARMADVTVPLRRRRGTHLVYKGRLARVGLLVEAADRKRVVFLLPFGEETLVGPTDVEADDARAPKPSNEEVAYLLESIRRWWPSFPGAFDGLECGWRPILGQATDEKLLSRDHHIYDHAADGAPGFMTIAGGKLSSYRLMAEDTVDLVCAKLGRKIACRTHLETLDGEPVEQIPDFRLPNEGLKHFLAKHPYLREAHAFTLLAAQFASHMAGRRHSIDRAAAFWRHFGEEPTVAPA
jgi:glycerol-3-phosphate dehydrogenase